MFIKRLQDKHTEYSGDVWLDYWALYEGGKTFRDRISRFLLQHPAEPYAVYQQRCKEACYRSYLGTIVDYFGALLFTTDLNYQPADDANQPDWASDIDDDADGRGTDLVQFARTGLVEAMVKGVGYWRIDFPEGYGSGENKAEAEKLGVTDVRLCSVQREELLDWECDNRGKLKWAIVHATEEPRDTPDDERGGHMLHRWWVLDRKSSRLFEALVKKGEKLNPESTLAPTQEIQHGLGEVPLVCLDVGPGLWVANRLESPQLEHFRLTSANNWSMRKTCYAMPVFSVEDPEDFKPTTMGSGYWLAIKASESMAWSAPPSDHLEVVRRETLSQKDEVFRLVTQMSLGVDNNAAAVGRSAESKTVDAEAIQVVLRAYGAKVREALRTTLRMLSKARGEDIDWNVEGLDKFDTLPADVLVELLEKVLEFRIPSDKFLGEVMTRTAHAMLPGLDKEAQDEIRQEIEDGVPERSKEGSMGHVMSALHELDKPSDEDKPPKSKSDPKDEE